MAENAAHQMEDLIDISELSAAELSELTALGLLSPSGELQPSPIRTSDQALNRIERRQISAHSVLNEAPDYGVSFSRGLRIELPGYSLLLISGTASVNERGETVHRGDIRAQCWRTYRNITALLASEGAGWRDVLKTTCYLRDIERDYDDFNSVRTAFFDWCGLTPLPASVGIQARLCREDLLVEIEALALLRRVSSSI